MRKFGRERKTGEDDGSWGNEVDELDGGGEGET
jgi:hypothetical protein